MHSLRHDEPLRALAQGRLGATEEHPPALRRELREAILALPARLSALASRPPRGRVRLRRAI